MATLDFGVRPIRRIDYNRVISLPKDWLRDKGIEGRGLIACRMKESGNAGLSAIPPAEEEVKHRDLERTEIAGRPTAPTPTIAVNEGATWVSSSNRDHSDGPFVLSRSEFKIKNEAATFASADGRQR